MNLTTKAERDKVDGRAAQLMELDRWTAIRNGRAVENTLMREFGINRQRAGAALGRAVRKFRWQLQESDPAAWEKARRGEYDAH